MFCQNCGKEIPEDGKFCANCKAKIKNAVSAYNENAFNRIDIRIMDSTNKPEAYDVEKELVDTNKMVKKNNIMFRVPIILVVLFLFFPIVCLSVFAYFNYLFEEETRGFDSILGHCNVSIYYNTSEYNEEKINDLLNNFEKAPVTSGNICLYLGTSKRYKVGIKKSLLGARVEAYQYGDNDYQETLFNEVYSNYNDAKEKFDSLCKEYKSEITWKFWKW